MEFGQITKVLDLPLGRFDGAIRVRVLWSWRGRSLDTKELSGANFILIDEGNARIQATAKLDDYKKFEDALKAGNIYVITNFTISKYSESKYHRPLRADKRIFFSNYTTVAELTHNPTCIPTMGFDIYSLDEVESLSSQSLFLIDVVGVVDRVFPTHHVKNTFTNLEQSYVTFVISDASFSIKVKFWDKFGEQFLDDMKKQVEQPVVIVVACAKAHTWSGDIYVNNNPPTRYYLNPHHYSVASLRNTLTIAKEDDDVSAEPRISTDKILTLQELNNLGPNYMGRTVTVQITITGFKEQCRWYKRLCGPCQAEVEVAKDVFKCPGCSQMLPFPNRRFYVHTLATDGMDTVTIILDDTEVRNLIGISFLELQLLESINDAVIPNALKMLLKKKLLVSLLLTKDNLMEDCKVFTCVSAEEVADVGESSEAQKDNHLQILESPRKEVADDYSEEFDGFSPHIKTPTTEQSTTARRVRKKNEAVPYDMDENTPLQKLKASKKERLYRFAGDDNIRLLTLGKISELNIENIQPEITIKCFATIVKIDNDQHWLFTECTYCSVEMPRSSQFTCATCGNENEEMLIRFKVVAHIKDETYSLAVVLPHNLILRLLRRHVPNFFPAIKVTEEANEALLGLEGKKLIFLIITKEENLIGKSSSWTCVDVEDI